tara:strand:- start:182 stop:421 length:240 start_codon:yes stop_codon:yes gene_type:complete
MKVLDEASTSTEAGLKTVTVVFKGTYHGMSMLTDTIIEERKVQKLKCKMKTNQTVEEAVAAGIDRDIAIAECAAIEAEI